MKQTDCHKCTYGDISDKPRTLTLREYGDSPKRRRNLSLPKGRDSLV